MGEAFAFLKGRDSGKHADVITEKEFVSGVQRLDLILCLQVRVRGLTQSEVHSHDAISLPAKKVLD